MNDRKIGIYVGLGLAAVLVVLLVGYAAFSAGAPRSDDAATSESQVGARAGWFGGGGRSVTVPAGTVLVVEVERKLSSETSAVGDRFTARVVEPVRVNGEVAIARGSEVTGKVTDVQPTKKIGGKARLALQFDELQLPKGQEVPISASVRSMGKSSTGKDAATIGGSTVGGALLGRLIGHDRGDEAKGTTIGALVGAAVGTAIAANNEHEAVVIPEGTTMEIRLDTPVQATL